MINKRIAILLTWAMVVSGEISEPVGDESGSLRIVTKLFSDCGTQEDMAVCLKIKTVNFLDRILKSPNAIPITDFMSLAHDQTVGAANGTAEEKVEDFHEENLPRNLDAKSEKLDELMRSKFLSLLNTRTVQLNFPKDLFEGRGKDPFKAGKKGGGMMMMAAMMTGMMMKMAMGKIALIAGKALIVGKIALVLSIIIGLKKLSGGSGGGDSHPQVVYATAEHSGGGGGGGWQRRLYDSQNMAYGPHYQDN